MNSPLVNKEMINEIKKGVIGSENSKATPMHTKNEMAIMSRLLLRTLNAIFWFIMPPIFFAVEKSYSIVNQDL